MRSEDWDKVQKIFHQAADKPRADQQEWLRSACEGDQAMIDQILSMLREDASGVPLLDESFDRAVHSLIDREEIQAAARLFGPYRTLRLLGEGGMGVVYLAEREDLNSRAAIKVLKDSGLSPMRRQRFAMEQKLLARLNHPFIARLYDADTLEDGTPYIIMEFVDGKSLTAYVQEHQPSIEEILRLFRLVCEATQFAHAQAVVHRDLKPSNILVTKDGIVKLVDFGIAKYSEMKLESDVETVTAFRLLTPAYSSPEQLRGEPVGIQADVYSLGVILYELLTSQRPYDLSHHSPGEALHILETTQLRPPSAVQRSAGGGSLRLPRSSWTELDTICMAAMHKDRTRRYPSVEALMRDLDHYARSEPLEARPDSFRYRAGRFVSRHRQTLGLLGAAALILILTGGFFFLRLARARRETEAEVARAQQIQRFMLNLFNGGDKETGPSTDLRVITLLDRGVQQARTLDQDPETQAELYNTLAGIYQSLGRFDRADPLLQSALEIRKRIFGAQSPKVADATAVLGLLRLEQAKPEEAERLTRAALALNLRSLSPRDPSVARTQSALGRVLEERGSYAEALPLLEDAVKIQSAHAEASPDLARSTSELATVHYYMGHYPTADTLNRQALALDEKLYGVAHPHVADDLVNLGELQHDLSNDQEAERLYRRALDIKKAWYGEEHPDTAFCMMALGQSLIYQKRYDDAFPILERSLEIQAKFFGNSHPRIAMAYNTIGLLEIRRGKLSAAEQDFERMAEINRSTYGDRHYLVGVAILNLGQVYFEEKNYARAQSAFQGALDRFLEKLPSEHPTVAIAQVKLGATLVLEAKYKEAEPYLLAGYATLMKQNPLPVDRVMSARKDLVLIYQNLHQEDKAQQYRGSLESASGNAAKASR